MEACITCTIIFLFVLTLAVLWFKGKKKLVKKIILELVALAEEKYGSGTGEIKLASVLLEIFQEYPWLEYLETWVIKWINEAVEFMNKSQ